MKKKFYFMLIGQDEDWVIGKAGTLESMHNKRAYFPNSGKALSFISQQKRFYNNDLIKKARSMGGALILIDTINGDVAQIK